MESVKPDDDEDEEEQEKDENVGPDDPNHHVQPSDEEVTMVEQRPKLRPRVTIKPETLKGDDSAEMTTGIGCPEQPQPIEEKGQAEEADDDDDDDGRSSVHTMSTEPMRGDMPLDPTISPAVVTMGSGSSSSSSGAADDEPTEQRNASSRRPTEELPSRRGGEDAAAPPPPPIGSARQQQPEGSEQAGTAPDQGQLRSATKSRARTERTRRASQSGPSVESGIVARRNVKRSQAGTPNRATQVGWTYRWALITKCP